MRRRFVALVSLLFTYLFFAEYLSPFRKIHIPFDLEGYHYPLMDYAFQALKQGRLPLWDAAIYCGQTLAGNVQAALFYPGTWLLFAANWSRDTLTYQGLQMFEVAHVWLAFLLCYIWLSSRKHAPLAAALGAGVYAYSGYMCTQLQHLGLVVGFAWFPFGFWGIDQAGERRSLRPLWKLAAASACVFLAGYPPMWAIYAICAVMYAVCRPNLWRPLLLAAPLAVLFSLALSAVQLLPAMEASALMRIDPRYGLGVKDPWFYLSYFIPNFFDFGFTTPVETNFGMDYLYLGAAGLLGVGAWLTSRRWAAGAPFLGILAASLVFLINPYNVVWGTIQGSELLGSVLRSWYFIAGVAVALTGLATLGLDALLERGPSVAFRPAIFSGAAYIAVMAAVEPFLGWRSALDAAAGILVLHILLAAFRGASGKQRSLIAAMVLLCAGVEFRRFGVRKRFDANPGPGTHFTATFFPGLNDDAYAVLRHDATYRVAVDQGLFGAVMLRHVGLTTPQGFDPLLTRQFLDFITAQFPLRTDREFEIPPSRLDLLSMFGVKYYVVSEHSPNYAQVHESPHFRQVGADTYYRVFEFDAAELPYKFEGAVERREWIPERRNFHVKSSEGGPFVLVEQSFPGWQVMIDGRPAPNQLWKGVFQSVAVPPGEHDVLFEYRPASLARGAGISAASVLALAIGVLFKRRLS